MPAIALPERTAKRLGLGLRRLAIDDHNQRPLALSNLDHRLAVADVRHLEAGATQ
jgi:hypothetical protein